MKTIPLGCFKNKKHLTWIKENGIYNIRLGNRTGTVDENKECVNNASILILYSTKNKAEILVFHITSHNVMTREDLKNKGYPSKKIGKRYITFDIVEEPNMVDIIKNHNLIERLIGTFPNHVSGSPIFLEP